MTVTSIAAALQVVGALLMRALHFRKVTPIHLNAGVRILVGATGASHTPSEARLGDRRIQLSETGQRRWYLLPLAPEDVVRMHPSVTLLVRPLSLLSGRGEPGCWQPGQPSSLTISSCCPLQCIVRQKISPNRMTLLGPCQPSCVWLPIFSPSHPLASPIGPHQFGNGCTHKPHCTPVPDS